MRASLAAVLVVASTVVSPPLRAGHPSPRVKFLVAGVAGTSAQEDIEPYVQRFVGVLAPALGWSEGDYQVRYAATAAEAGRLIRSWDPTYAFLPVEIWLQNRAHAAMTPLLAVQVDGKTTTRYRVVALREDGLSLAGLEGQELAVTDLEDPDFLRRVVFRGGVDPGRHFRVRLTARPLRVLRQIARGEGGAILLNDAQLASARQLPFFERLQVFFESPELPLWGVVAFGDNGRDDSAAAVVEALLHVCARPEGAGICELANIQAFVPASRARLEEVSRWYGAE